MISSPDELYCELFDDFLNSPALTKDQRKLRLEFRNKLNAYPKRLENVETLAKFFSIVNSRKLGS